MPALRATRGGGPLETLVRLFLLQRPVPLRGPAPRSRPRRLRGGRLAAAATAADEVRATVDVRPYAGDGGADWWIVSDLGCAVGGAGGSASAPGGGPRPTWCSASAARPPRWPGSPCARPVGSALDLGTGSGVQALHAARHATRVTATDVNPRALHFARLTLALSGAPEPRPARGSLFEPVGGRDATT